MKTYVSVEDSDNVLTADQVRLMEPVYFTDNSVDVWNRTISSWQHYIPCDPYTHEPLPQDQW